MAERLKVVMRDNGFPAAEYSGLTAGGAGLLSSTPAYSSSRSSTLSNGTRAKLVNKTVVRKSILFSLVQLKPLLSS